MLAIDEWAKRFIKKKECIFRRPTGPHTESSVTGSALQVNSMVTTAPYLW